MGMAVNTATLPPPTFPNPFIESKVLILDFKYILLVWLDYPMLSESFGIFILLSQILCLPLSPFSYKYNSKSSSSSSH